MSEAIPNHLSFRRKYRHCWAEVCVNVDGPFAVVGNVDAKEFKAANQLMWIGKGGHDPPVSSCRQQSFTLF